MNIYELTEAELHLALCKYNELVTKQQRTIISNIIEKRGCTLETLQLCLCIYSVFCEGTDIPSRVEKYTMEYIKQDEARERDLARIEREVEEEALKEVALKRARNNNK